MRVKWKCIWNVVKLYLIGIAVSLLIIVGVVWIITNWTSYISYPPSLNESYINTTNYAVSTQGCGCGISTSIIPVGMIFIGILGLIYMFYLEIKPCIIWEEK